MNSYYSLKKKKVVPCNSTPLHRYYLIIWSFVLNKFITLLQAPHMTSN